MKNEIYGSGNYQDFMNDSSNHAHDGANGHEGIPEQMQRLAKENSNTFNPVLSDIAIREIARKLLKGEL